jgi:hypothetical protein
MWVVTKWQNVFNCIWHEHETSLFEGYLKKKQYGYCLVPCCGIADTLIRIFVQERLPSTLVTVAFNLGFHKPINNDSLNVWYSELLCRTQNTELADKFQLGVTVSESYFTHSLPNSSQLFFQKCIPKPESV